MYDYSFCRLPSIRERVPEGAATEKTWIYNIRFKSGNKKEMRILLSKLTAFFAGMRSECK